MSYVVGFGAAGLMVAPAHSLKMMISFQSHDFGIGTEDDGWILFDAANQIARHAFRQHARSHEHMHTLARLREEEVAVVGGGNSAGQAAVFLAQSSKHVHMVIRSGEWKDTMSRYLINRIEGHPKITRHTHTEITAVEGNGHLEHVKWRNKETGSDETRNLRHVFVMTGADPCTSWLEGCVALDAKGFIKTGPDLSAEDLVAAHWPLKRLPHLLETSLPGVFAVGDVRCASIKRVASAVGEGSIAIAFVHQALHD